MLNVDTLINARWIVPVEPEGVVLDHHSLIIDGGRILDILPATEAKARYRAAVVHDLGEHVLMPGLVNAHTHAAMCLLRGLADDLPLATWLNDHIWPVEGRHVSAEFVHDGTLLAAAELIRGGVTCINDMYFFPDMTAKVCSEAGLRAGIGIIVIEFPSAWANNADEYIEKGLALHDAFSDDPLISFSFAPHAPYTVSDQALSRILTLAGELRDIPIHMHVHETAQEVEESIARLGVRPLERLDRLGLLNGSLTAVHMTQLTDAEIERLAAVGANVVHCPESNLKLASGFCPAHRLVQAGVNVAIGTDGAASNNDLDMFGEMRVTALLAKGVSGDATALPAPTVLRMATLNGARALGIAGETGSLVPGKAADVIAIRLDSPETLPIYNVISQIVYSCGRHLVSDVWVAGRHLLKDRELTTIDQNKVHRLAAQWCERIATADCPDMNA